MKLFLSSLAISKAQSTALNGLVGKKSDDIKLALIENAADPYDQNSRGWVDDNRTAIQSHGYDVQIIDLRLYKEKLVSLADLLKTKDIIWLGGGNTFYLRWILHDTGVDKLLTHLVQGGTVYGGGSAGAIMAGPTLKYFDSADDPADAPKLIDTGLNLTNKVVVPHTDNPKFASLMTAINDRLTEDGYETIQIGDSEAFVVNGSQETII